MKFSVDVKESTNDISNQILKIILQEMSKSWGNATRNITNNLPDVVVDGIKNQPEYLALNTGLLRSEFGLTNSTSKVNDIINIWANNIVLENEPPKIRGSQIVAYYSISMIRSDYTDVLSSPSSRQLIEGGNIPWLNWLLLRGGDILVPKYEVKYGPDPNSRTGNAVMIEGGNYRVDPKYAGVESNNWVTRAVGSVNSNIQKLIETSLRSTL